MAANWASPLRPQVRRPRVLSTTHLARQAVHPLHSEHSAQTRGSHVQCLRLRRRNPRLGLRGGRVWAVVSSGDG